jgi:hypothetical protein
MSTQETAELGQPSPEQPPTEPGTMPEEEPATAPEPETMPDEPGREPSEPSQPDGPQAM